MSVSGSTYIYFIVAVATVTGLVEGILTRWLSELRQLLSNNKQNIENYLLGILQNADSAYTKFRKEKDSYNPILEHSKEIEDILSPVGEALYELDTVGRPSELIESAKRVRMWSGITSISSISFGFSLYIVSSYGPTDESVIGFALFILLLLIYVELFGYVEKFLELRSHMKEHELLKEIV